MDECLDSMSPWVKHIMKFFCVSSKLHFFSFVRHCPRQTTTGKEEKGGGGGEGDEACGCSFVDCLCRFTVVTTMYFRAQSRSLKMHLSTMIT